jgi:hypothetical protein
MTPIDGACSVCGRSILPGERTRGYLDGEGVRRTVCELCRHRAERLGWIWEEEVGERGAIHRGRTRAGLLRRLRRARERGEELPAEPEEREEPPPRRSPDPAAPGAQVGRVQPEAHNAPRARFERALVRFNVSEAARTVAGLMRTLGEPLVSVGASAGSPHEVRVTVAWELTWYQWGVDLADELRPVFQLDKGLEIDQLDASARQWNARALEGGRVELGLQAGGRRPDGEPVGLDG